MNRGEFARWVKANRGIATREQLLAAGVSSGTIAAHVKHGEWQRLFHSVYLLSPSIPSWDQRLRAVQKWTRGSAVFSHSTAAYLHRFRSGLPDVLEVTTVQPCGFKSTPRCKVHRTRFPVRGVGNPPRTTMEQTALDLIAESGSESEVLEILMKAVQNKMDVTRFITELSAQPRIRHRAFAMNLVEIVQDGVESHLELIYRRNVERAHGLPHAVRQKWERLRGRWLRSDVWYKDYKVRSELDGELAHPGRATNSDLLRDNDVLIALDEITLRYRWPHVWNSPCVVAGQVARALRMRGWQGEVVMCSSQCVAREIAGESMPTAA